MELLFRHKLAAWADRFFCEDTPIAHGEQAHLSLPPAVSTTLLIWRLGSRTTRAGNSFLCPSRAQCAYSLRSRGDVGCCFQQNPPTRHRRPDTVVGLVEARGARTSIMQTSYNLCSVIWVATVRDVHHNLIESRRPRIIRMPILGFPQAAWEQGTSFCVDFRQPEVMQAATGPLGRKIAN